MKTIEKERKIKEKIIQKKWKDIFPTWDLKETPQVSCSSNLVKIKSRSIEDNIKNMTFKMAKNLNLKKTMRSFSDGHE